MDTIISHLSICRKYPIFHFFARGNTLEYDMGKREKYCDACGQYESAVQPINEYHVFQQTRRARMNPAFATARRRLMVIPSPA
jgi:phage terminase small subunit